MSTKHFWVCFFDWIVWIICGFGFKVLKKKCMGFYRRMTMDFFLFGFDTKLKLMNGFFFFFIHTFVWQCTTNI